MKSVHVELAASGCYSHGKMEPFKLLLYQGIIELPCTKIIRPHNQMRGKSTTSARIQPLHISSKHATSPLKLKG